MGVLCDAMKCFARLICRIDMNDDERHIAQMVQEPVADLGGDGMGLRDRQVGIDSDIHLDVQTVAEPTGTDLGNLPHLRRQSRAARRRRACGKKLISRSG